MYKAFIFDLDGTLFSTIEANVQAYAQAFAKADLPFDETTYRNLFGLRFQEMLEAIAPQATEQQAATVKRFKARYYAELTHLVEPNTALIGFLQTIHPGYKTALVTTARKDNATLLLDYFAIDTELFDIIVTGETVAASKPDPECYNIAIKELAVPAEQCCVFEDSDIGVEAATLAGTKVIRIRI